MKKFTFSLIISAFIISTASICQAKFNLISLSDGSTIKGNVLGMTDGYYKIQTEALGVIEISEDKIETINSEEFINSQKFQSRKSPVFENNTSITNQEVAGQVQQMQTKLMSDPAFVAEIQTLMQDKEVMAIMSDPNFMNAVMTMDPNTVSQDKNTEKLLKNKNIQKMINKIQNKMNK